MNDDDSDVEIKRKDKEENEISKKNRNDFFQFINWVIFPLIIFIVIPLWFLTEGKNDIQKYTIKSEIKIEIISAFNNGADLRSIKNIYYNRNVGLKNIKDIIMWSNTNYYNSNTPLSLILEDIRSDQYLIDKSQSSISIDIVKFDGLIEQYNFTNPFDKLESGQKDSFESIRLKLEDNYKDIEPYVNKVVNELSEKNSLVNKYLKDSTISFWISIVALFFSLLIGIYQIYQSRSTAKKQILIEAITSYKNIKIEKQSKENSKRV